MTKRKYTEWHVSRLAVIMEELKLVEIEYRKKKAEYISNQLGIEIFMCDKCHRPMLPRRLWDLLPAELRAGDFARGQDRMVCWTHYLNRLRAGKRLEAEALNELRARVGFNPSKNYDSEEESP